MTVPNIPRDFAGEPTDRHTDDGIVPGPRMAPLSRDEFATLWQRHGRIFWALAAGVLGRPDEIEDVLQDAAMIGISKLAEFERDTSFTAWMGRVVRFVALNRGRLRMRRQTEATDPVVLDQAIAAPVRGLADASGADGDLAFLASQIDDELLAALSRLKTKPRACLLLRALAELDYDAIGEVLGIRSGTAMSHVHRARGELQRTLAPGGDRTTTTTTTRRSAP